MDAAVKIARAGLFGCLILCQLVAAKAQEAQEVATKFAIAVISDTQNYLDFRRQRATNYPFDGREMFFDQMNYIARNTKAEGGDIAFVTAVGDIWQTASKHMDPAHAALGLKANPLHPITRYVDAKGASEEFQVARQGYALISGKVPFSVVPGNHDYDAAWSDSRFTDERGQLHYGGLNDFNTVFGAHSDFFRNSKSYVDHFNGGADSAQLFAAGGYTFLHIGLEMAPDDAVLEWANRVVARHPGLPTLITTHDYLSKDAQRKAVDYVDFHRVHNEHNTAEDLWRKFISRHNQIFLVLCGHQLGQARRVDAGENGGLVWQLLADYQERAQSIRTINPNGKHMGTGDGWLRLMTFELGSAKPTVRVRTYSTYYHAYASDLPLYAQWYKSSEQPQMTDAEFLAQDEFTLDLTDFQARFGAPSRSSKMQRR